MRLDMFYEAFHEMKQRGSMSVICRCKKKQREIGVKSEAFDLLRAVALLKAG